MESNLSPEAVRELPTNALTILAKTLTPTGAFGPTLLLVRDEINRRNGPPPGTVVVEFRNADGDVYSAKSAPTAITAGHVIAHILQRGESSLAIGSTILVRDARDPHHVRAVVLSEGERQAIREAISKAWDHVADFREKPGVTKFDRANFLDAIRAKMAD